MGGLISKVINKRVEYITGDKDYEDPKITLNDIKIIDKKQLELKVPKNKRLVWLGNKEVPLFLPKTYYERFKEKCQKVIGLIR